VVDAVDAVAVVVVVVVVGNAYSSRRTTVGARRGTTLTLNYSRRRGC